MSSSNRFTDTKSAITEEIDDLKTKCFQTCSYIAMRTPEEMHNLNSQNLEDKSVGYLEGLSHDIEATSTRVLTDENLITSQFLVEINDNISDLEKMVAYNRGLICDVESETNRLKSLIKMAEEAKTMKRKDKQTVRPEHVQKARHDYRILSEDFKYVLDTFFPQVAEDMLNVLSDLMQEKLNEESNGYIEIETENFKIMEMLLDMGLVVENPYDKKQVKLA